jgi:hypothetical protein
LIRRLNHGKPVTQRPDLAEHGNGPATGLDTALQRREIDLNHFTGLAHPLGGLGRAVIGAPSVDQTQFDRGRVREHHVAAVVEQHHPVVRGDHNPLDPIGDHRTIRGRRRRHGPHTPADEDPHDQPSHQRTDHGEYDGCQCHLAIVSPHRV